MELLCLADVKTSPTDRVFRHSRARGLLGASAAVAASAALVVAGLQHPRDRAVCYGFAAVFLFVVLIMQRFVPSSTASPARREPAHSRMAPLRLKINDYMVTPSDLALIPRAAQGRA